jgi:hypothetical protein
MFDYLIGLFQFACVSRQMFLRSNLLTIHITKKDTMVSYMVDITNLKEQLATIGTMVEDKESIFIALNGLITSWRHFIQVLCTREKFPTFTKLWDVLSIILHEDCTCDLHHPIQRFARWHDDSSLLEIGILVEDVLIVHHVLHGLLGLNWK